MTLLLDQDISKHRDTNYFKNFQSKMNFHKMTEDYKNTTNCFMKLKINKVDENSNPDIVNKITENRTIVKYLINNNFNTNENLSSSRSERVSSAYEKLKEGMHPYLLSNKLKKLPSLKNLYNKDVKLNSISPRKFIKPGTLYPSNKKNEDFLKDLPSDERQEFLKIFRSNKFVSPRNLKHNLIKNQFSVMNTESSEISKSSYTNVQINSARNIKLMNLINPVNKTNQLENMQNKIKDNSSKITIKINNGNNKSTNKTNEFTKYNIHLSPYSKFFKKKKFSKEFRKIGNECKVINKEFSKRILKFKSPLEKNDKKKIEREMDKEVIGQLNVKLLKRKKDNANCGIGSINVRGQIHNIDANKANLIRMADQIGRMNDATALYLADKLAHEYESKAVNAAVDEHHEFLNMYKTNYPNDVLPNKLQQNSNKMRKMHYNIIQKHNKIKNMIDKVKSKKYQ